VRGASDGQEATLAPAAWSSAVRAAANLLRESIAAGGPGSVAVLGGARGTNEDALVWARLAHEVIGTPNVDAQLGDGLPYAVLGLPRATIDETCSASTIVLLGPDLKEELPVLYLRIRDAAERRTSRILEFSARDSGLTRYAWRSVRSRPGEHAAAVRQTVTDPEVQAQLGKGPVVVVLGRGNLAESPQFVLDALDELRVAVPSLTVLPALRRGNVVGALQVGLRPGDGGLDGTGIITAAAEGRIECLVLLGADPMNDHPDVDLARRALAGARRIIAVDSFLTDSSKLADVVLPAATRSEKSGTTTNLEGRVTPVARKVTARGTARPDWMIGLELALELGTDLGYSSADEITDAIAASVEAYRGATREGLRRARGSLVAVAATAPPSEPAVRAPEQNNYDYRLVLSRTLWDEAIMTAKSPALANLTNPTLLHVNPLDLARIGTTNGASVLVSSQRASVVMLVQGNDAVQRGTVWVPFNHPGVEIGELVDSSAPVTDVRVENL
jgi:NADH-quinone oxidoreductase subunit G